MENNMATGIQTYKCMRCAEDYEVEIEYPNCDHLCSYCGIYLRSLDEDQSC